MAYDMLERLRAPSLQTINPKAWAESCPVLVVAARLADLARTGRV